MTRQCWLYMVLAAFILSVGGCSKPGPAPRETPLVPPDKIETKGTKKPFKLPENPDE